MAPTQSSLTLPAIRGKSFLETMVGAFVRIIFPETQTPKEMGIYKLGSRMGGQTNAVFAEQDFNNNYIFTYSKEEKSGEEVVRVVSVYPEDVTIRGNNVMVSSNVPLGTNVFKKRKLFEANQEHRADREYFLGLINEVGL